MDYESLGLLHDMFRRQAEQTPDRIAVNSVDGRQVTFKELNEWTDILATSLQNKGVLPDTSVGIYLEKNIEFVTAYIAALKAGGAYLLIDSSYPDHIVKAILEDAKPIVVVTMPEMVSSLKENGAKEIIALGAYWQDTLSAENKLKPPPKKPEVTLDSLAYIIYSSGTTGKPKGIMCPHRGAVFSYHWRHENYPYADDDREACNIFFTWEMLRPLLKGATLYPVPNTIIYDMPLITNLIKTNHITRMLVTPSLLETILNTSNINLQQAFKSLRQIWFCGEVVTTVLFKNCLKRLPNVRFINLYSVSECHDVAACDLTQLYTKDKETLLSRKFCPVGRVLPGVEVVILNDDMVPQSIGLPGEIYVGGPTLAIGYLNNPTQQTAKFIQRPETVTGGVGGRLYRTGDWGYLLADGSLEICGRCDSMVKIRGYSIEIQAVENAFKSLSCLRNSVILVQGEEGQDKYLIAYVVLEKPTTKKEIRQMLKRKLPFYMIPSYFIFLDQIPIVEATGKINTKALPSLDKHRDANGDPDGKPTTTTEITLADIWSKILKIGDVDIQESFFDSGGHSLLAAQLLNKVREVFEVDVSVSELFAFPTVYSFSRLIENKQGKVRLDETDTLDITSVDLISEVEKHDQQSLIIDMQLRAFWRTFQYRHHFQTGRVLLTGATGFLGAFLLQELLLNTKLIVYCVVREHSTLSIEERLEQTLLQYGIIQKDDQLPTEQQQMCKTRLQTKVRLIKGEIALTKMGMTEDDYTYLCTDVDFIIHAAASVNLAYPYQALHGANVLGTCNVIAFACTGKVKPLHYISTDAVIASGVKGFKETDSIDEFHNQLSDGYSQSKWVAEKLVQLAGTRGLPVTIYRPGNMSGDSINAYWNPQDFTLIVLQTCTESGLAPKVDWKMEMTPVDFVAKFIIKIVQNPTISMKNTFHIVNDKPLHSRWVFEWMNAHGFPLEMLEFNVWRERVLEKIKTGKRHSMNFQALMDSYLKNEVFVGPSTILLTENFKQALADSQMVYPYIDSSLLTVYFENLSSRGVLISASCNNQINLIRPLSDKVVIVTGASSGIGAAVAVRLANLGAKVALVGRREGELMKYVNVIKDNHGVGIPVKADVTNRSEVEEMVRHTELSLGPVDILVNSAGVMYYTYMKSKHYDEWERQIDINCKGLTSCIGAVLTGMIDRKFGHIINISSNAGKRGFAGLAVYSGTKFYVEGLSQALRHEVKEYGIKVTCIQPGDVKTNLLSHTTDKQAKEEFDGSESCTILEPDDIAKAIEYVLLQPQHVGLNEILVEPQLAPI
ncbi:uncharacterized protein LOC126829469 isoform X1 [Patella vulgata]|uniref:uncharacterized protein LOC126829469 isoform X1 n=3 Tax=Patella vulgata TaxID=6465 RepID=UPI00217FA86C|nr:uncharacterized protein LOC126829469 isoform X1 [Patella vulgata]XP_055958724.1 uncharacterized protein LOC126829469 isoform X1 [Patella vulgata]